MSSIMLFAPSPPPMEEAAFPPDFTIHMDIHIGVGIHPWKGGTAAGIHTGTVGAQG